MFMVIDLGMVYFFFGFSGGQVFNQQFQQNVDCLVKFNGDDKGVKWNKIGCLDVVGGGGDFLNGNNVQESGVFQVNNQLIVDQW